MHELRKHFSLSEANSLVPTLDHYFREIGRLRSELDALVERGRAMGFDVDLDHQAEEIKNYVHAKLHRKIEMLNDEMNDVYFDMLDFGVVVDDIELGMVNFYSFLDNEEVFLSWQYGEPAIYYWHRVSEDFFARRPIEYSIVTKKPPEVTLH
ncbi:DUF2203 domain-containing protein [bacterium]|nr:DUF2203 domain-containing protein [bacterium]